MRIIASFTAWRRAAVPGLAQNLLIITGVLAVANGASRIYQPAGEIVLGIELLGLGYLLARAQS